MGTLHTRAVSSDTLRLTPPGTAGATVSWVTAVDVQGEDCGGAPVMSDSSVAVADLG